MFPEKARSELVRRLSPGVVGLVNDGDGGVVDTSRRFQIAWPASHHPARSPTRGSGDGGAADSSGAGAVSDAPRDEAQPAARPAAESSAAASEAARHRAPDRWSSDAKVMTGPVEVVAARPACCACGR